MTPAHKVWTLASVSALFGAVAACGSFSADDGNDTAPPAPTLEAGSDAVAAPDAPAIVAAPPCTPTTDLAASEFHCGRCSHSCLGGTCAEGVCQTVTLAKDLDRPRYLRQFGPNLFFVTPNAVMRALKIKDQGTNTFRRESDLSGGIAVDADNVFAAGPAGVHMYGHDGRGEVTISSTGTTEVAVQGAKVFTCLLGTKTQITQFTRSESLGVQFVKDTTGCESIATDASSVYFGGDHLYRAARGGAGSKLSDIKISEAGAHRLAIDDTSIFSTATGSKTITRRSRDDPAKDATVTMSPAPVAAGDIALDATHVYWTTGTPGGGVYRAPKGGGPPEVIAEGEALPFGVAVDDDAVYWSNFVAGGEIRKRAK